MYLVVYRDRRKTKKFDSDTCDSHLYLTDSDDYCLKINSYHKIIENMSHKFRVKISSFFF